MNECHKCKHFTERELGWCGLFNSTCMAARAVPTPVKVLEPGISIATTATQAARWNSAARIMLSAVGMTRHVPASS